MVARVAALFGVCMGFSTVMGGGLPNDRTDVLLFNVLSFASVWFAGKAALYDIAVSAMLCAGGWCFGVWLFFLTMKRLWR